MNFLFKLFEIRIYNQLKLRRKIEATAIIMSYRKIKLGGNSFLCTTL